MKKKVLVLHPNDEQKIIRLQEEIEEAVKNWLCESDTAIGVKIFRHFPLWCETGGFEDEFSDEDFNSESVNKRIAGGINGVRIFKPEFFGEGNKIENVSANVEIVLENKKIVKTKLILLTFSDKIENEIDIVLPDFEMELKIFRIGDATFEENRYFITDGVWRKLNK